MTHAFVIRPAAYTAFADEEEQLWKCKEWGLVSEKAAKTKTFVYKGYGRNISCAVVGYVDDATAVIAFEDGTLHCIHPSYLKEMQAAQFGARSSSAADDVDAADAERAGGGEGAADAVEAKADAEKEPKGAVPDAAHDGAADALAKSAAAGAKATSAAAAASVQSPAPTTANGSGETKAETPEEAPKGRAAKATSSKLKLPEDKVRMRATVKQFATVPNHFADQDDEVIVYEDVAIEEPPMDVGAAWSSHSATLKKLDLQIGDSIRFEAKIVAKKLTKHPVPYKINNPSKIEKQP